MLGSRRSSGSGSRPRSPKRVFIAATRQPPSVPTTPALRRAGGPSTAFRRSCACPRHGAACVRCRRSCGTTRSSGRRRRSRAVELGQQRRDEGRSPRRVLVRCEIVVLRGTCRCRCRTRRGEQQRPPGGGGRWRRPWPSSPRRPRGHRASCPSVPQRASSRPCRCAALRPELQVGLVDDLERGRCGRHSAPRAIRPSAPRAPRAVPSGGIRYRRPSRTGRAPALALVDVLR